MNKANGMIFKMLGILLALLIVLTVCGAGLAATPYPTRPVRLIVPTAPGGGQDTVARLINARLSERLGQQVIAENRGGGGGVIGTEIVAKSDPDGYTLLIVNATTTIQPGLQELPYNLTKSFTPIAKLATGTLTLVVHPGVPANSVKELIALAKQKAGQLIFASSGTGSVDHMTIELFKMTADIDFKIVQFKSGGPAMVDLLGGHSHALIHPITGTLSHIKSGKLRILGTGGAKRSVILPDVPTIGETLQGFNASNWYGILAPAKTPAPIVEKLNNELNAILTSDDVKKQLLASGAEVDYLGLSEFGSFIEREVARWSNVTKKANIKIEK